MVSRCRARRHGAIAGLAGVLVLLVAACGSSNAPTKTGAGGRPDVTIGIPRDGNVSAQIILADSLGYFSAEGVNVKVQTFPSAGELVSAVAGHSISIGAGGTTPVTTLKGGGYPVAVLSQLADISGAQQVVARPEITTPADLKGQKMGALFGTVSELLANKFLAQNGLSKSDVTLVNLGSSDMITTLSRGDIKAAALWEPNATTSVDQGNHRMASGTKQYLPTNTPARIVGDHAVLFADEQWANDNKGAIEPILRSLRKASSYIMTNKADAMQKIGDTLKIDPAAMKNTFAVNDYTLQVDQALVDDMQAEADFLHTTNKIRQTVSAKQFVRPSDLRAVDPSLVTWTP